jgi:hypothetical protein
MSIVGQSIRRIWTYEKKYTPEYLREVGYSNEIFKYPTNVQ